MKVHPNRYDTCAILLVIWWLTGSTLVLAWAREKEPPFNAIVVGGSSGMGKAAAKEVIRQGGKCLLCDNTVRQNLSRLRAGSATLGDDDNENNEPCDPIVWFDFEKNGSNVPVPPQRAILLMDAFCPYHGLYLASRVRDQYGDDTAIIPVLSNYLFDFLMATHPQDAPEHLRMRLPRWDDDQAWAAWIRRLPPLREFVGVYCESDSGLADAERLRQALGVTCRDEPDELEARRNKFLLHERIRATRGEAPPFVQKLCETLDEAQSFATTLLEKGHKYVVVKPTRGVASEAVELCQNVQEVAQAFDVVLGSAVFGSRDRHESVLLQQYLEGPEYAVDVVSRNGQHKVAAVWRYDKRPANGASFCYYQTRLVDEKSDLNFLEICRFADETLTSLGIRYGISHNEVIVTEEGPMLVEVNCRQHNMDFLPITMSCIGYNALDMLLVSMLGDEEEWKQFPNVPILHGHGCMVHLVNSAEGTLRDVKYLDEMSKLKSFLDGEVYEYFLTPGTLVKPTVDIRSDAGWVQLVNENEEEMMKDYSQIVAWMPDMFKVEETE